MKIGIPISNNAYTPEAYAYEKYLTLKGHEVQLDYILDPNNDVNIYFMGMRPLWEKSNGKAKEIHEYQSISTPPYPRLKNFVKKIINSKPDGRIYLNSKVRREFNFNDNTPYIYRDMGIDDALFQNPVKNPDFDILYCGSILGRTGLIKTLIALANKYKIVVVGKISESEKILMKHKNITLLGRIEREKLPEIYRNARFGLNYTPNIYPYNIQTSTKTLEYLASGLQVISNRYLWAEEFFDNIHYKPLWLDQLDSSIVSPNEIPIMHSFKWDNILNEIDFNSFVERIASK